MKSSAFQSLTATLALAVITTTTPAATAADRHPGGGGWIGAYLASADNGARIEALVKDGPADKAGLRAGDVVTAADGKTVGSAADFSAIIRKTHPGKDVAVKFARDGKDETTTVKVGGWPDWFAPQTGPGWYHNWREWTPDWTPHWRPPADLQDRIQKQLDKLRQELNELREKLDKQLRQKTDKGGSPT
jgi:membrane-associated protease RseP (regulator of RpoE activity)